ncbi:exo-alpha-sialidase [Kineococcus sp. R8]|uniref:sialidase family protein n=1 Tax=Kineococcus siccus TaxID=2696567 RepID=UPI0014122A7E|nr:sialidase family protein [Kineococcus siccus]NAZ81313.1 exo-alpha-sialidase [Kineococcus siccus]
MDQHQRTSAARSQPAAGVAVPPGASRRAFLAGGVGALAAAPLGLAAGSPASAAPRGGGAGTAPFGPVTLYAPPADRPAPGTLYARAVRLSPRRGRGSAPRTLLATFEQYVEHDPVFPVFRSDDDGRTWSQRSSVRDTVNGWGLRYQPFLYELPRPFAGLPRGTVLCAGNSIPDDLSQTKLDLYASTDRGLTWRFLSSIARGGRAVPNNGETPVWEPFLLLHGRQLVCYYSDQRDPAYGQKIVHQTSTDLRSWGPVVDDVTVPEYLQRPGMPTVAALPDGSWIMTYEGGVRTGDGQPFFAVHHKTAADPLSFGAAPGQLLVDQSGHVPTSSPTVAWSPAGGRNGTVVVSANSDQDLFVNRSLGAAGAWTRVPSVVPAGYTRFTIPLDDGLVFTVSGGTIGNSGLNRVTDGIDQVG